MALNYFNEIMIILAGSVVATALFRRLRLPPTLAYLLVGCVIGPYALGLIGNPEDIGILSEFGLVFLLFSLGLEFSLPKLNALRHIVFGLGGSQVLICTGLYYLCGRLLDFPPDAALIAAGALALSSTAIVTRELTRWNELNTTHGYAAVGVLLFQDLAAVVFLILIPALAGAAEDSLSYALVIMLLKGIALFLAMLAIGKWVLPYLFHEVSRAKSDELFVLTVLLVALTAAWVTHALELSMALGAFLAGMMLSESHYKHQIEADIRPFRDVLLGLFFVSIGMQFNLGILVSDWHWILLGSIVLILTKAILIAGLGILVSRDWNMSLRTGLVLAQGGEFGFALLALALNHQLIDDRLSAIVIATVIISIGFTPLLVRHNGRIANALLPQPQTAKLQPHSPQQLAALTADMHDHVIICGYGRVGQTVARFLNTVNFPVIALDNDPLRVQEAATAGENIIYGDGKRREILEALGLNRARLMVITFNEYSDTLKVISTVRHLHSSLPVLVRTKDDTNLEAFQLAGATEVVPEILEGSLMLVSHVLTMLDIPLRQIARTVQQARKERYRLLHGYYHGQQSQLMDMEGNPLIRLHPTTLSSSSYATGKTIAELNLARCSVNIQAIRRHNETHQLPDPDTVLKAGDIVILSGMADHIEQAESILLSG